MPVFAAVDIGANSVRLKIARLMRGRLRVEHEDREVTRLGASVFQSGLLAPEAMAHTIKVLQRFHRSVQQHACDAVRVVATSSLRDAGNSRSFIEWARAATGWRVEVISGLEEGRLIHLGIALNERLTHRRVLMVDLGGGSCEFTISVNDHIKSISSVPLGAVRLTGEFLKHDPPRTKELARMREFIAKELRRLEDKVRGERVQLVLATSGTAAALAAATRASYGRENRIATVTVNATTRVAEELADQTKAERAAIQGIGPKRAEIIVAGAAVFAEFMHRFGLRSFRYSPLGLRDGLLAAMAADYDRGSKSHQLIETDRGDSLLAMAKRYQVDLKYAERTRDLALQLFRGLKRLHGLPQEYEELLGAAAMLHEVGGYLNRAGAHRHSFYIIKNSEIFGFTPEQRNLVAVIARFVGKSKPAPGDRFMKNLLPSDMKPVITCNALLRLARALNQGRRSAVTSVRGRVGKGQVTLFARARGGAELEMWALAKEASYFRFVFGRALSAETS
jgi:exopolyphosphatase / guanosine-5'-triphosphate,3'-diphosphate pyrophosphatase